MPLSAASFMPLLRRRLPPANEVLIGIIAILARLMGGDEMALFLADPPYGISVVDKNGHIGSRHLCAVGTYAPVYGDDEPFEPGPFLNVAETVVLVGAN